MKNISILLFDEEELTKTLVESYLKELTFTYDLKKYDEFDEQLIPADNYKIIIVNVSRSNLHILDKISDLSKDNKNKFVVISNESSTDLHVKVLRTGAKDFLLKPLKKADFIHSLQMIYKAEIMNTPQKKSKSTIFLATSVEKGTGKTTFIINLAKELADVSGEKVLLIDFNNTTNDISFLLNVDIQHNTSSFINRLTVENAPSLLSKLVKYQNSSLYVMANGFSRSENNVINERNIYNVFQILKQHFKYIFIDIDTDNEKLYDEVIANTDVVWMLTHPSLPMFDKIKQQMEASIIRKTVRVVLNKYEKKYEPNLEKFQAILGKPIYCKIPKNFMAVGSAQTNTKTLKEVAPDLNIVKAYMSLAKHIASKG